MAGYHKKNIEKGILGQPTKIREEFEEFYDAINQNNTIMAFQELSDMLGAMEAFLHNYHLSIHDLINMNEATKRAFAEGARK